MDNRILVSFINIGLKRNLYDIILLRELTMLNVINTKIAWNASIEELDLSLYNYFDISLSEQEYIENRIKSINN